MDESVKQTIKQLFPFMNQLGATTFEHLTENFTIANYPAQANLMKESDHCSYAVFVLDGCVRVFKPSPDGKEITLYRIYKGEACLLTLASIMGQTIYPAIAEVDQPVTLLLIPSNYFRQLFNTLDSLQKFVFELFSKRLTDVLLVIEEVAFESMDKRLANFLHQRKQNECVELTHEEIALELGTAREVISRLLKDLEKQNIITLQRKKIIILNAKSLCDIVTDNLENI